MRRPNTPNLLNLRHYTERQGMTKIFRKRVVVDAVSSEPVSGKFP